MNEGQTAAPGGAANPTAIAILDAAQEMMQSAGYNGISFRDLAAAVGIKSASVHYHFATKTELGIALARRYADRLLAEFDKVAELKLPPQAAMAAYLSGFRQTLQRDGRMCLAGILAAEIGAIPPEVQAEVRRFIDLNVAWLADVIEQSTGTPAASDAARDQAIAIFASLEGAMMIARGSGDYSRFDAIAAQLKRTGLLPN